MLPSGILFTMSKSKPLENCGVISSLKDIYKQHNSILREKESKTEPITNSRN